MGWLWQLRGGRVAEATLTEAVVRMAEWSKALHSGCSLPGRRGFESHS